MLKLRALPAKTGRYIQEIIAAAQDGELVGLGMQDRNGVEYVALVRAGEGFDPQNTKPRPMALVLHEIEGRALDLILDTEEGTF